MSYLVDTDVLVDVSRGDRSAINYVDGLNNDWALCAITALEFIAGAKNQQEVGLIDRLIGAFETIPIDGAICRRAYELLKIYAKSHGLRTFDSLIAATAMREGRTLATMNRKHFEMIAGLTINIPDYQARNPAH